MVEILDVTKVIEKMCMLVGGIRKSDERRLKIHYLVN